MYPVFDEKILIAMLMICHLVNLMKDLDENRIFSEINPPLTGDSIILNLWSPDDLGFFLQPLT